MSLPVESLHVTRGRSLGSTKTVARTGERVRVQRHLKTSVGRLAQTAVDRGLPPVWTGYRWLRRESVPQHVARRARAGVRCPYEVVHPEAVAHNALPRNVARREELSDDQGWWGYSFRDVPRRLSAPTFLATLPDCRVVTYRDAAQQDDFYPAILTSDDTALELREIRFRPGHARALRASGPPVRLQRATWVVERVYHNHSHWLSAHLPKLLMLAEQDALEDVLLPAELTPAIESSLRLFGLEPEDFRRFDPSRPLQVAELTVVGSDRFRPELLQLVQRASGALPGGPPTRRVFISRAEATRRRLVNEDEVWPMLADAGFERTVMENLSFDDQVRLMRETAVLFAPHGAGLTNMLFCPPGARVVEVADLSFPNPNFYATAAALGHDYWLHSATPLGDGHPLERDLHVDAATVRSALDGLALS